MHIMSSCMFEGSTDTQYQITNQCIVMSDIPQPDEHTAILPSIFQSL